jgi:hypothetical protein
MAAGRQAMSEQQQDPSWRVDWSDANVRAVQAALADFLVRDALEELDRPHVVVVTAPDSVCVIGPYPDALAAVVAAEQERHGQETALGDVSGRAYDVHPLCDPA